MSSPRQVHFSAKQRREQSGSDEVRGRAPRFRKGPSNICYDMSTRAIVALYEDMRVVRRRDNQSRRYEIVREKERYREKHFRSGERFARFYERFT